MEMHCFLVTKLALDDSESVFNLASHRGLTTFNITIPMKCVIRYFGQTAGATVDTVINAGKVLAAGYFVALLNTKDSRSHHKRPHRLLGLMRPPA